MKEFRKLPNFYGKEMHDASGVFLLMVGFGCLWISTAVVRNSLSDSLSCVMIILFGLSMIVVAITFFAMGTSHHKEKNAWFENASTAQTTIMDRQEIENDPRDIDYANAYGYYMPSKYWYLTLKLVPSQLAIAPKEKVVSVGIDESQYKKYAGRTSVTIYYSPADPFVFLLEDEM
jgi:hypothetical protein